MEVNLGEVVSINAILRHVQILEGFKQRKTRPLPKLNNTAKKKRVRWADILGFFWRSGNDVSPQVEFVLYHLDENWFYADFTCAMDKVVTSIGL